MVRKVKHQNNVVDAKALLDELFRLKSHRLQGILEGKFNFSIRSSQKALFRGVKFLQRCFIALEALLTEAWRAFGFVPIGNNDRSVDGVERDYINFDNRWWLAALEAKRIYKLSG